MHFKELVLVSHAPKLIHSLSSFWRTVAGMVASMASSFLEHVSIGTGAWKRASECVYPGLSHVHVAVHGAVYQSAHDLNKISELVKGQEFLLAMLDQKSWDGRQQRSIRGQECNY